MGKTLLFNMLEERGKTVDAGGGGGNGGGANNGGNGGVDGDVDGDVGGHVDGGVSGAPAAGTLRVSCKAQRLPVYPASAGCVRDLLELRLGDALRQPRFVEDVTSPLEIDPLMEMPLETLSGGEASPIPIPNINPNPNPNPNSNLNPNLNLTLTLTLTPNPNPNPNPHQAQRVAIALCLGVPADLYLLDEPSAYLDSEMRISMCRAVSRFVKVSPT